MQEANLLFLGLPPIEGQAVLVAVSGGADSVALLHQLQSVARARRLRLTVAHFHHGIRGTAADEDAAFVRRLAHRLHLRCVIGKGDVPRLARSKGLSLEMAARAARYAFLARTARRLDADVVATAHTADDQAETILLNLLRGTGAGGLAGIPRRSVIHGVTVFRPLLDVTRNQIVAYLKTRKLTWREDESNQDPAFLRNRVRHDLLPMLERKFNPQVRAALLRAGRILRAEHTWLDELARLILADCTAPAGPDRLRTDRLRLHPLAARRRVVRLWLTQCGLPAEHADFEAVERIERLLGQARVSAAIQLGGGWLVQRRQGGLSMVRAPADTPAGFEAVIRVPGTTVLADQCLRIVAALQPGLFRERSERPGALPARASLNAEVWHRRRLTGRSWQPGDRMRPYGFVGSKKIQDILTDGKVPRGERSRLPLIVCGGQIVWLPGYRIAQGWEVAAPYRCALQLVVEPLDARPSRLGRPKRKR